ncbi:MAG: hypothetical protein ACXQTW_02950, partial [Candidatus Methanospirareceae archaeon]
LPVPESIVKKAKSKYSEYGLDKETTVGDLQENLLNVCATVTSSKNKFVQCLDEGAKMTRRKIMQIRKSFGDKLREPVTEETVEEIIEELNTVKSPDGSGLGEINEKLIMACAQVADTVDDLLTCIDEGEKIPIIINKDLAKLL